jgi:hypothetical protein
VGDINKFVSGEIGELKKHIEIRALEIIDSEIITSIYKNIVRLTQQSPY